MKTKKILALLGMILAASALFAKKITPSVQEVFKPDNTNKKLGYQFIDNENKIIFVFDSAAHKIQNPLKVYVEGSFNGWSKKNPTWELSKFSQKIWTLECETPDISIPGNSGFPEFRFVIIADISYTETVCGQTIERKRQETIESTPILKKTGFKMGNNNLILLPGDNPQEVIDNTKIAEKVKKLKEFNLDDPEDQKTIANFRLVPGTTRLFRGYHPYKISRKYDTEKPRLQMVNKLIKDNGIQSIITLSGNEQLDIKQETISVYVGDIRQKQNQLFIKTHYNDVYYNSAGPDFGKMVKKITDFINSHPGPYYIHCRIGTDRTGVLSAVFASLCGASWDEIKADYQKSNNTGIEEFRDWKLLQYSFEQILGKKMSEVQNLQKEMSDYFIENRFLTKSDIANLQKNL